MINLATIDDIIALYWNDDQGQFEHEDIKGNWTLNEAIYSEDEPNEIEQYIFTINVESINNKPVNENYQYILNNLEGDNELIKIDK